MEMTPTGITLNDQQRDRIAGLLALEVQELSSIFLQLQDATQAATASSKLFQQLDARATQLAGADSWKVEAEEAKASLTTEKINYEQRLQQQETKNNAFKSQLTITRQKLQAKTKEAEESAAKKSELEAQLSNQHSGSMHANVELEASKARIEALEGEKRELVAAFDRKVGELEEINKDYQAMSTRYQELRKESSKLESEAREAKAADMSRKLHTQSVEQELELLKQRAEWTSSELKAKSTEFASFRTDKSTQILKLQSDLDQSRMEATSAKQSNAFHERRVQELQTKLDESNKLAKDLEEKKLIQEEQFRTEIETQRRLGELWEREAKDTKGRIADLEETLDDMQRLLSTKDSEYQETLNRISEDKVELQVQLERSSIQITQLKAEQKRAEELLSKAGLVGAPGASGHDLGPLGILSPTAAIAGRSQTAGLSLTQVYTRYMDLQGEYAQLKAENARLETSMNDIVTELSDGAPLIREQQLEYERVSKHNEELSIQLETCKQEKEQLAYGASQAVAQLDGVVKERDLLHRENQDMDRQVQNLLWRLRAPNAPQSLAPESTLPLNSEGLTDAEKVINDHLVLFADLQSLQQQNKKLRQAAREMAQERENAEGAQAQERRQEEQEALEEAGVIIESMREQIGSKELQLTTYKQEVDMLRRILRTSNIRHVPATEIIETPVAGTSDQPTETAAQTVNGDTTNYPAILTELQKTFDDYRTQTVIDINQLKDDLQRAQSDSSNHRIQLGQANAQIKALNEHQLRLMENNNHQMTEMTELRKQYSTLHESATRRDISYENLASELDSERESTSQLTVEVNHLKTEKALWKSFETRLIEENQALVKEKGNLNDLLRTVQNLTTEIERGSEETTRRLESTVTNKEREVETLKEKLKEEVESGKRLRDRREVESKEWQGKIDTLTSEYQTSREALIAAKTSLEHTKAKVEDLTKEIKSREEQLAIYQQKPAGADSTEASREEQLIAQVAQLRGELSRHQAEAASNREHLVQFQAISQTNEDRLAEMTATFEEFKKSHDQKIEESAQTIKTLETKLASAEERAQTSASNMVDMQNQVDQERSAWRKNKEELEARLHSLENIKIQMNAVENRYKNELRHQGNLTKEAHENYERELMNHAKDMEALTKLKEKHTMQTTELERFKYQAENAASNLQSAEIAWEGQKSILQKNLSEVEKRCTELKDQNEKLHRHLEDVSAQALSIQQRANAQVSSVETGEGASTTDGENVVKESPERQLAELRDVIRYVRREKEILECQHELNLQESRRLKQQLDQTNKSLEETRALLSDERNLQQEAIVSKELRERLTEKANQLSVIRDSNTLLRAENQKLLQQVQALESNGRRLSAKIGPLNARVLEVEAEIELRKQEQTQIGEDRDRWRTRAVEIMAKHDRIDPTEFQELKDANEKFKIEAAENATALAALKTEQEALQARVEETQGKLTKMTQNAQLWRKRSLEEATKLKTSHQELEDSKAKVTQLEKALEEVNTRAGSQDQVSKRDRESVQKSLDQLSKLKEKLETENKELKDNKEVIEKNFETIKDRLQLSIARNKQLVAKSRELQAQNKTLTEGGAVVAATPADTQALVDAAVKEKEAELEKKYASQAAQAAQVPAPGSLTPTEVQSRIDEEKKRLTTELTHKHEEAMKNRDKMAEMRQQIKIQTKDKEIASLKAILAANGQPDASKKTPLSTGAGSMRPPALGRGARPPPGGAPAPSPGNSTPAARPGAGLPARPGQANAQLNQTPGQSRLRPPFGARNAAAISNATAQPTTTTATPASKPAAPAETTVSEPVPTIPSTPAPTPVAPTSAPIGGQASRPVLIKRRREDDLPANLSQAVTTPATTTSPDAASETSSPAGDSGATFAAPEAKAMLLKRQRPLPVVESTSSPTSPAVTSPSEPKAQAVNIQRKRVTSVVDTSESQTVQETIAHEAHGETETITHTEVSTTETLTTPLSAVPHGQKRRHEATESVQENITVVSTPNPSDLEELEEVLTPDAVQESTAMDVDEVPPVKRQRPSSQVTVTEIEDEHPASPKESSATTALPTTPGPMTDLEDTDIEEHGAELTTTATGEVESDGSADTKAVDEDVPEMSANATTAADHSLEEDLDEGLEGGFEAGATTDLGAEEEEEVHTPQGTYAEEGELDLDLEGHRDQDPEGEGSESTV
ncbi:hypothetical protein EC957_000187 [Mortierella hygrophila]|uniref:Nucleoprotein TPR/MLP1 domain-containing protein n=1 Tax=Mortierella hygrophila TaxID=979708 RepID=A0A9P6FHZ4_9FUNG|nr:hypothetical protein EC957_000187 [Mortierella hygrophila]